MVFEFGKVHWMWLLPDEEGIDFSWGRTAQGIRHFAPAGTSIAHLSGSFNGAWEEPLVYVGMTIEKLGLVPKKEMERMPEYHFQVEFAVPTIICQAGFLWWIVITGAVDGSEVLREYDAPLKFRS